MNLRRCWALVVAATLSLLALAPVASAMGNAQECVPEDLVPVNAWVAEHPWRVGPVNPNGLVASACKQSSGDRKLTIVVAAYDLALDDQKSVVVALVDYDAGVVRATAPVESDSEAKKPVAETSQYQ